MTGPLVTVVIPTRDRRASLLRLLEALEAQDPGDGAMEVVVVDDGSADGTAEALAARTGRLRPRVLRNGRPAGPPSARNAGAAAARGEFLAFLDDDALLLPGWWTGAREALAGEGADLLQGGVLREGTGLPLLRAEDPDRPSFLGPNLLVRRSLFERLGGFDPAFHDPATGLFFRDETDLGFRALDAGARCAAAPGAAVSHPDPFPGIGSCLRHVRRYLFDPLLRRRHPARYRESVEVKRVLGLRIRRPLHRAALAHAALLAGAVAALAAGAPVLAAALAAGALAAAALFRARYRGFPVRGLRDFAELPVFAILPLLLLAALLRGSLRARRLAAPPRPG